LEAKNIGVRTNGRKEQAFSAVFPLRFYRPSRGACYDWKPLEVEHGPNHKTPVPA
jgi:hypothetical protein